MASGPWQQGHFDPTYWVAVGRVRLHLGEAAQRVLSGALFSDRSLGRFMICARFHITQQQA